MTDSYRLSARPPREAVIVGTFDTPHEAELARVFLESRDIETWLKDDTLVGMAQLYSAALGGVKVLTDIEDAEEAQKLLVQYRRKNGRRRKRRGERADNVAKRAFRAAIIGVFLCPGGLHVYTLFLLTTLDSKRLSKSGKRNAIGAGAISIAVIAALIAALVF